MTMSLLSHLSLYTLTRAHLPSAQVTNFALDKYNIEIGNGLGDLAGKCWRVGETLSSLLSMCWRVGETLSCSCRLHSACLRGLLLACFVRRTGPRYFVTAACCQHVSCGAYCQHASLGRRVLGIM